MAEAFQARDISLRAQKKLLSKMSNKMIAKTLIDDTYASILDNLYQLAKTYTGNKKEAEKLVKDIIKVVVKVNFLARSNQFSEEDLSIGIKLRNKFSVLVKTIVSFFEVDFSFDKNFLTKNIEECRQLLKDLVGSHLTEKSIGRINHIFDFFGDSTFLEEMFRKDSTYRPQLQNIVDDINKAIDAGEF